jgi:hypothetical protein
MARQVPFRREAQLCSALDYLSEKPAVILPNEPSQGHYTPRSALIDEDPGRRHEPATSDDDDDDDDSAGAHDFTLPDYPHIHLSDRRGLLAFLRASFCAPDLERMAPHLWMMSTQSSSNISPLHHQLVKGRQLVLTEDPRLHCVWIYNRIFLKPLPAFLLSHAFWRAFLLAADQNPLRAPAAGGDGDDDALDIVARSALGYLRTYAFLVQHPSDFALAQHHRLVPPDISLPQLRAFTALFAARIADADVSARYQYGELRLSRLNFYGKFILRRWHFMRVHTQYGEYFGRFYGPLLFVFTVLSLILNALQVEMAVEQAIGNLVNAGGGGGSGGGNATDSMGPWTGFWELSRWAAVLNIAVITVLAMGLVLMLAWFHADEWKYAIKDRIRRKRELRKAREV